MKALKKHAANATNETTFSAYVFIFFFCFHLLLCVLRNTDKLKSSLLLIILENIGWEKLWCLGGSDFLRVDWEVSNLQWTSSQSRGGVRGGELAMDENSIQGEWQYPKCIHYAADEVLRHVTPDSIAYRIEIVIAQFYQMVKEDSWTL